MHCEVLRSLRSWQYRTTVVQLYTQILSYINMHSHHSHSGQFCKHAVGTLEDVVQTAMAKGFTIFGLSEHVPKYRVEDRYPEEA